MKSFLTKAILIVGGLISSIFGLHRELAKDVTLENQTAQTISSQIVKPTPTISENVGIGTTTPTLTPTPPKQTNPNLSKSEVESIVNTKINSLINSGKLKGPKGDKGDTGEKGQPGQNGQSGITTSYTTPSGYTVPAQNLTVAYTPPGAANPGSVGGITYFSSKEIYTNKVVVGNDSTIGSLFVTGDIYQNGSLLADAWISTSSALYYTGNVGIGTSDPVHRLQIGDLTYNESETPEVFSMGGSFSDTAGEYAKLRLYEDSDENIFGFGISLSQLDYIVSSEEFDHVFYGGGAELMRIKGNGNIGIGTADPFFKLHVAGDSWFEEFIQGPFVDGRAFGYAASDTDLRWSFGTDEDSNGNFVINQNGNDWSDEGVRLTINRSGQVGIATSSPWRTLSVTGTLALDGLTAGAGAGTLCLSSGKEVMYSAGATCTVSSERFKHDIATSTTGLDFVNKLRPVTFFYNDDIGVPGEQYGFIAEEVETLDPRLVVHDKDGNPFSVRYENMAAVLAKAIQEQQIEIDQLESEISSSTLLFHDESSLLNDITHYSGQILQGVWHFIEIITDKITATLGIFKRVETGELQAETATINRLKMKDQVTGDVYCITVTNGEFDKKLGDCQSSEELSITPTSVQVSTTTPTPESNIVDDNQSSNVEDPALESGTEITQPLNTTSTDSEEVVPTVSNEEYDTITL